MSDYPGNIAFYMKYFKYVPNIEGRFHNFSDPADEYPDLTAMKQVMLSQGKIVYISHRSTAEYWIKEESMEDGKLKYHFSKEKFNPSSTAIYYKKSCFFKEYLNRALLLIMDMYINMIIEKTDGIEGEIKSALEKSAKLEEQQFIQLGHLSALFTFTFCLVILAMLTLFVELAYARNYPRFKNSRNALVPEIIIM